MIVALLVLASVSALLLVVVVVEVALFLRVRQGDLEELLIAVEAEARSTRLAISGHATPAARDAYAVLERIQIDRDGDKR